MRYYTTALLTILAAAATAQDISIFPECSLPCILKGIETTPCMSTDFVCVCQNKDNLVKAATSCVLEACGAEVAVGQVLPATDKFCSAVGSGSGSSSRSGPSSGSGSSSRSSPSPSSGSGSSNEGKTTRTPTSTSKAAEPTPGEEEMEQSTTTGPNSSFITPAPTSNSTATRLLPVSTRSVVTAGAAAVGYIGSLGMMALGALAAF